MSVPIISIISDIRKTGYALLLTEVLNKVIHKEDKNEKLFLELKKMIILFEHESFNSVFGIFLLKEILLHFGIQPINNYSYENWKAAFLNVKLKHIQDDIELRRKVANYYLKNIKNSTIILPTLINNEGHVWHLFVIRTSKRNELQKYLSEKGVQTIIHYPIPPHLQKSYKHLGFKKGDFPVAEKIHKEIISIPLRPNPRLNEIDYISEKIRNFK